MKKTLCIILSVLLIVSFAACGNQKSALKIAVPNDTTNEARALRLLEVQGVIKLKDTGDALATKADIAENPYNVEIYEVEAAQIPSVLPDVAYAVINSNYAIEAGLTPFVTEGTDVSYPNVICVKEGNENSEKTKALVAAVNSKKVADYILATYKGAIVCDLPWILHVETGAGSGFDTNVDYEALKGQTIKIACSPTPHAGILAIAKEILAEKDITLEIIEYTDYVVPNQVVESGEVDANFFAHVPYQQDFNEQNGTHLTWVLEVHHEPMGVYSDKSSDWSALKAQ